MITKRVITIVGAMICLPTLAMSQQSFPGGVSPVCLSIDCGDGVTNDDLSHAIKVWQLDLMGFSAGPDGAVLEDENSHDRTPVDIELCTSVCYGHFLESDKACVNAMQGDGGRSEFTRSQLSVARGICRRAVRDQLYSCVPACIKHGDDENGL